LALASWGLALSFSKKGSKLLLSGLLRVGDGDLLGDGSEVPELFYRLKCDSLHHSSWL
jgi:hypothetical protein